MVQQVEVQKTRRSNMAHSSVNGTPKKGGAGGSYTWEGAAEVTDYEPCGFDLNGVGVTIAIVPNSNTIMKHGVNVPFDENLEDQEAFPCLPTSSMKLKQCEAVAFSSTDNELAVDLGAEWVVVAPPDAGSLRQGALDLVDTQHPRHLFAKKANLKRMSCEAGTKDSTFAFDWSETGMPQSYMKQIVKASMNATHQGLYTKEHVSTLPLDMLRAQNGSSSRQNSRSRKNSVPRSSSKPRAIKQPTGRR